MREYAVILAADAPSAGEVISVVEDLLQQLLRLARDLAALLREHVVDRHAADDLAHRSLRRVAQRGARFREPVARGEGVLHHVLHHEAQLHDVVVAGLHGGFGAGFVGGGAGGLV